MDILVTRRLTLRPPLEVDAEAITQALGNPNVSRMLSRVPQPYAKTDAREWIARAQKDQESCHFAIYGQALLGVISVEQKADTYNLGYWLAEPHWGKAYMSEAARAVLSYAFRTLGCQAIQSGAYEDNPASRRILEKLGFESNRTIQDFNVTRKCDVPCHKVDLPREKFERLFGPVETNVAA